ncbi:hypothetical protein CXB51_029260 [Gossypium anomalum]|uniref:Uncharacterized protein n=6 Tax=Gossypium TaxID=3633 RepID=A0A2P5WYE2_GOSBA|nr:hypothetical protein ES319_A11G340800v1 [Gossypium barbadense]KAG8479767.1 hypothetical protein CXB51_029260 [Gossypium anomalum]KAK5787234.1 hypothetical protein PVK06_041887 [Gossypium arboreum]TYG96693.1 hypothetical protein ES288_A11G372100v1 [Gossypium darwinii]TYI03648.1 hypothetical protein ES332_A11G354600v1 [Gossypium tomentosum]TYJ12436.1 hypothetical protein E1A91_A11G350100v1 [Gossypium mustelinum]
MARTRKLRRWYRRRQRQELERGSDSGSSTDNNGVRVLQSGHGCCTPKGQRFKIPEILACPPAPMKPKVAPKLSSNRTFFASQDMESFFFLAFQKCH